MKLRPLGDRVVVRRDDHEGKTKSGLIIPDIAQEKLTRGTVIAVGPGRVTNDGRLIEPKIKAGDHIVFGKYSGSEFEHDAEQRICMREEDIMAVIEED